MTSQHTRFIALAAAALAATTSLAACGSSSSSPGTASSGSSSGTPTSGGTLRIVANGGPEHNLDTVPSYLVANYILLHAFTRQLLNYPTVNVTSLTGPSWTKSITLAPDVATAVPTAANGGITGNGLVYTFHIRPGVDWNSSPARQVTADDFIREYKAFCNPVDPVGNIGYFESTISGLDLLLHRRAEALRRQGRDHGHRRRDREFPEHAHHQRGDRAELDDPQVQADPARHRLQQHDGDAVRLGPAGRVRLLPARQRADRAAPDVRRAVPDQQLGPEQDASR